MKDSTIAAASLALVLLGCAPADEAVDVTFDAATNPADMGSSTDATTGADAAVTSDAAITPDAAGGPPTDVALKIEFDFRFDDAGFLASEEARGVLAEAARQWGVWLRDDFETIEAGSIIYTKDPEDLAAEGPFITLDAPIDDLLVFVGSAPRDGQLAGSSATAAFPPDSDDPVLRAKLKERWDSAENFEPWTGWVSYDDDQDWFFDPTPTAGDDIPAGAVDALSVTLHELGHVLGVAPGEAFGAHVVNGMFEGPHAVAVYGGPVPLANDLMHIADGVTIDGKVPVMSTRKPSDVRYEITRLDRAILADVGYELP